jgi:hypothetical protein
MAKITKFGDKVVKVADSVTIYFYDNAYMVEVTGRDVTDEWTRVKLVAKELTEVLTMLQEIETIPKE